MQKRPSGKTVIFDLGGVLIDWNPRYLYRKVFAGNDEKMEWFLRNVCNHKWNEKHDAGVSWKESIEELVLEHPEFEKEIRLYRDRWEEMLKGPIEENVKLLDELRKKKIPLYSLTNWSVETFKIARARFEFLNWFIGIVVSGEIKMVKPDPQIYQYLLDYYKLNAADCIYIDDVEKNVMAANKLGFEAIWYQSPTQLREELNRGTPYLFHNH